jgi:hypothetical protein
MSIQSRYLHTLVVKRLVAQSATADETPGGADTILVADVAAGSLTITVDSDGDMLAGDYLRVGDVGGTEVRRIATIGPNGVITLTAPLALDHDSGDQVREVDGSGATETDEWNQPVMVETTVATVPGLVQPRRAREVALASQAGVVLGEHIGYLDPLAGLTTHDWVMVGTTRYDILSIADAGGVGHHLELGLKQVT